MAAICERHCENLVPCPKTQYCTMINLNLEFLFMNYKVKERSNHWVTALVKRFTLSILLPTSIFMMSFLVEYISTSLSHSSSLSNVSLLLVSYTKGKQIISLK